MPKPTLPTDRAPCGDHHDATDDVSRSRDSLTDDSLTQAMGRAETWIVAESQSGSACPIPDEVRRYQTAQSHHRWHYRLGEGGAPTALLGAYGSTLICQDAPNSSLNQANRRLNP